MTEPTVQVRAVADVLDRYAVTDDDNPGMEWTEPEDVWRLFRDLRALLSQSTPTSEPTCKCGHEARTHDALPVGSFGCHVLRCSCRSFTSEPHRIEDMAPGTTGGRDA